LQLFLNLEVLLSLYIRLFHHDGINNVTIVKGPAIIYQAHGFMFRCHVCINISGNCIVHSSRGGWRSGCLAGAKCSSWKKLTKEKCLSINRTDECFNKLICFPLLHGNKQLLMYLVSDLVIVPIS